jgi:lysine-specific demethylase 8
MKFPVQLVCVTCVVIIATSLAEFPPKYVEDPLSDLPSGHLKAFGYHRLPDGPVAEEKGFLHPKIFWGKYVSIHNPMVFRQAISDSPAILKWTDGYLVETFGDLDIILEVKRENRMKPPQRANISSFIERYIKEDIYAVTVLPDPMRAEVQVLIFMNKLLIDNRKLQIWAMCAY